MDFNSWEKNTTFPSLIVTIHITIFLSLGTQDTSSRHSVKKGILNETSSETDQVSSTTIQNSEESVSLSLSTSLITPPDSNNHSNNEEIENENVAPDEELPEITPVSVSAMELVRSPNKRRMAPRPPESTEDPPPVSSLFARNPSANLKSDSPVVREKEKRERSSSCSPKFRKAVCELPDPTNGTADVKQSVESVPRRTISLSQDSLTNEKEVREEKKRGRNRRGFSLKRFLRMGSRKDMDVVVGQSGKSDEIPSTPQPKPRLEIIHPLELDGAAVEVVLGNDRVAVTRIIGEDQTDSCGTKSDGSRTATRFPPSFAGKNAEEIVCDLNINKFEEYENDFSPSPSFVSQRDPENHRRRRETSPLRIGRGWTRRTSRSDRCRLARRRNQASLLRAGATRCPRKPPGGRRPRRLRTRFTRIWVSLGPYSATEHAIVADHSRC